MTLNLIPLSTVVFSRAAISYRVNKLGNLVFRPNNIQRLDHDPFSLQPLGLLVEPARTNLILRSEAFTNAVWAATAMTVTDNVFSSINATTSDAQLLETTAVSNHEVAQTGVTVAASTAYAFEVFAVPIGARNIQLQVTFPGAVSCSATIDLTTGAIIATSAAVAFAEQCLNGRWRVVMIASSVGAGTATTRIRSYNGAVSFAGSVTAGLQLFGAQFEAGDFASSYIPTLGVTQTRPADDGILGITGAWNNLGSTLLVTGRYINGSGQGVAVRPILQVDDGTDLERIIFRNDGGRIGEALVVSGGVTLATLTGAAASSALFKAAIAVADRDFALCVNGGAVVTNTNFYPPYGMTRLLLGQSSGVFGGVQVNARIITKRVTNAELIALTT